MVLEVLIALLIFSLGVLGLVGLQARAAKDTGQAQYRAQAVLLANELVGMMWAGDHTNANLSVVYASGSTDANYVAWINKVKATLPRSTSGDPTVTLTAVQPLPALAVPAGGTPLSTPLPSTLVTIQVYWDQPGAQPSEAPHKVVVVTQIK
jgi:type IV pilus assembly protein PilV